MGDARRTWGFRSKTRDGASEQEAEDKTMGSRTEYGASVSEEGRVRAEEADATGEGSSRYSMVSVPSRRGSGLDVVSSQGRFVTARLTTGTRHERVIHESKSVRKRAVSSSHGSPGRSPPRPAPQVPIDDPEIAIRREHDGTIGVQYCLNAIVAEVNASGFRDSSLHVFLFFF